VTNHRQLKLIGAVVLVFAVTLLACDSGNLIAFQSATATSTRTPRPTFTPQPSMTPTPDEDTPTPLPTVTNTPRVPPTATRGVVVSRPATKAPTAPPAPKPVVFPIRLDEGYACPQPNDPIWKVTGRIQRDSDKGWADGYSLGIFTRDGRFLKASGPSAPDYSETLNGNCRAYNRYRSNVEVDVAEFRMQVPLIIRVIRSKSDLTPLSQDFTADFAEPGNYYVHYFVR
jgi:hypothetical protein